MDKASALDLRQRLAKEYLDSKGFADSIAKRTDELKKSLVEDLIANGTPDDKGNLWCPAGDYQLKRERRVSESFDAQAAEKWAKLNGFWDQVVETIEVLNEDKLLALGWEDQDVAEALRTFYTQKETWAFKVVTQKSYDDE